MCRSIAQFQLCRNRSHRRCKTPTQAERDYSNERRRERYALARAADVRANRPWCDPATDERDAARAIIELPAEDRYTAVAEWLWRANPALVDAAIPRTYRNATRAWSSDPLTREDHVHDARLLITERVATAFTNADYDPEQAPPRTYIRQLGEWVTTDLIRRHNADKRRADATSMPFDPAASVEDGGLPETAWGVSKEPTPEEAAIAADQRRRLWGAIGLLPPAQRELMSAVARGETLAGFAERTGQSLSSVKKASVTATGALRGLLIDEEVAA